MRIKIERKKGSRKVRAVLVANTGVYLVLGEYEQLDKLLETILTEKFGNNIKVTTTHIYYEGRPVLHRDEVNVYAFDIYLSCYSDLEELKQDIVNIVKKFEAEKDKIEAVEFEI